MITASVTWLIMLIFAQVFAMVVPVGRVYSSYTSEVDDIVKAFYHDEGNADIDLQSRPMATRRMESEHLQKVLSDYDGNISAGAMGMHRRTLQRKLQKKPVNS